VVAIPDTIPDVGSVQQKVRRNPNFDPTKHGSLTSEDYFVFSRIDGLLTVREILLETGFGLDRAIEIVRKLKRCGAFLLPDERPYTPGRSPARKHMISVPARPEDIALTADEKQAVEDAGVDMGRDERLRVVVLRRRMERGTLFELLGVGEEVDRRELKRAYFALSKQLHPDRYYGRELGVFRLWLSEVFEGVKRAFEILDDDTRRAEYRAMMSQRPEVPAPPQARTQTHAEHAAELFERACAAEAAGDHVEALKLFAGANRVDPQPRTMRRAGQCALAAGQLSLAEEYAKKAAGLQPDEPSSARLLARVLRAEGKLVEAETTLERALSLSPRDDTLNRELQSELSAVRTQLGKPR
jgi:tetratricopeptide (TPR) repeat protein